MTKTELIKKLAEITGLPQKDVRAVLEALTDARPGKGVVSSQLRQGHKVIISGFGTFHVRERRARQARNPKTGGKVKVPKRVYPAFKPSKSFKDSLKG
jgi:DNA-binding protein HU-beta